MNLHTFTIRALFAAICVSAPLIVGAETIMPPESAPGHGMPGEHAPGMGGHGPGPGERGPGPGMGERGPGMGEHEAPLPFLRGLALSEAQQDKVFNIMYAQEPQHRDHARAARKAHEALHALVESGQYDEAKASALAQAGSQALAALALLEARTEAQVLAVLTTEQRKQLDAAPAHRPPHA